MQSTGTAWSNNKYTAEQMLWSAVLETALNDALTHKDPEERKRAIKWFKDGGQHFQMVCDMANYEPNFVQSRVLSLIEMNNRNTMH
ncbi:MAG: hypothetical protein HQL71_14210 [Magnetococcales bacterium]|nr:hypothetical protein [Magnetococcales bacterium]